MRRYVLPLAAAAVAAATMPSIASAQQPAIVTTDVNMRAGPSTEFPVVDVIPDNDQVAVFGCIEEYEWCDVGWRDTRGWVAGEYLRYRRDTGYVPLIEYGPTLGLPVVVFSFDTYWDRYYRARPWYRERVRWSRVWRDRRDDRAERREDRREDKAERREDRREDRVDRRQDRREDRAERREDRRDVRADRRQDRRESRVERRVERQDRADVRRENRREIRAERSDRRAVRAERRQEIGRSVTRSERRVERARSGPSRIEGGGRGERGERRRDRRD
jgi:uncharacterized protein YraI